MLPLIVVFVVAYSVLIISASAAWAAAGSAFRLAALPLLAPLLGLLLFGSGALPRALARGQRVRPALRARCAGGILGGLRRVRAGFPSLASGFRRSMLERPMLDPVLAALFTLGPHA